MGNEHTLCPFDHEFHIDGYHDFADVVRVVHFNPLLLVLCSLHSTLALYISFLAFPKE
jgi:hypothetical protein